MNKSILTKIITLADHAARSADDFLFRTAEDAVFQAVDFLLRSGDFQTIEKTFEEIDWQTIDCQIGCILLMSIKPAKEKFSTSVIESAKNNFRINLEASDGIDEANKTMKFL